MLAIAYIIRRLWLFRRCRSAAKLPAMQGPHGKNLRKGRYSQPGRAYLVTMVVARRRRLFSSFAHARVCVSILRWLEHRKVTETLAYVVMPDHIHWLCIVRDRPLPDAVQIFKSLVAKRIRKGLPCSDKAVWQRGFHDRALRAEEDLAAVARYIVANPVRAGLVPSVRLYPHWDCVWVPGGVEESRASLAPTAAP